MHSPSALCYPAMSMPALKCQLVDQAKATGFMAQPWFGDNSEISTHLSGICDRSPDLGTLPRVAKATKYLECLHLYAFVSLLFSTGSYCIWPAFAMLCPLLQSA